MKVTCFHHSVDWDGWASRDIVKYWAEKNDYEFEAIGWTYGMKEPTPDSISAELVFICDICFSSDTMKNLYKLGNIFWIDHHTTAIDRSVDDRFTHILGLRYTGKGACELTWEFLFPKKATPVFIEYLSTYDVWDKKRFYWNSVMGFQYGMRVYDSIPEDWFKDVNLVNYSEIIDRGTNIITYLKKSLDKKALNGAFDCKINNLHTVAINSSEFSSMALESVFNPEYHHLMCVFNYEREYVRFSLYTTFEDIDCSQIARSFGGGGHKGAAGFQLSLDETKHFLESKYIIGHDK